MEKQIPLRMSFSQKPDFPQHAEERKVQGPPTGTSLLKWAGRGHQPHPSIQTAWCLRGDQQLVTLLRRCHKPHRLHSQPGKHGFVVLISSSFCTEITQEMLLCHCSQDTHPQPNVSAHTEAEVVATIPSPTSSLQHLCSLFDDKPLNHCF